MLNRNIRLNDYDFVLYHLCTTDKFYRAYYKYLRKKFRDRLMILDNSAYEFWVHGTEFNAEDFMACIKDLEPDMYILPDKLMGQAETLRRTKDFWEGIRRKRSIKAVPMAVAQGATPEELLECLEVYKEMGIDHIAIPFHNRFFASLEEDMTEWINRFGEINEDMRYAAGRVKFVKDNTEVLRGFEYVHLLGSHNPYEKTLHAKLNPGVINSIDTGYPVKVGALGHKLFEEKTKPELTIDKLNKMDLDSKTRKLIDRNVQVFKNL